MTTTRSIALALLAPLLAATACGETDPPADQAASTTTTTTTTAVAPVIDPGDGGEYAPQLDPADFVATVDNPYFPLIAGTTWVYEGQDDDETERVEVEVLADTRVIEGITATIVRDTVYIDGELAEDTYDWYAQDVEGNVWYLGEDTHEYEGGVAVNAKGAWEYGKDGALPGIVMLADPDEGDAYRQEYDEGQAEDLGEVLHVGVTVEIELGAYDDVVVTEDWNPLEPDVVEEKSYAPGIGLIREEKTIGGSGVVELVSFTPAS
jgi:hypothetical protein